MRRESRDKADDKVGQTRRLAHDPQLPFAYRYALPD